MPLLSVAGNVSSTDTLTTGALSGAVYGTNRDLLPGVTISIPALQRVTITDSAGKFDWAGLQTGTYTIICNCAGYKPYTGQVQILPAKTTAVTFQLKKQLAPLEQVVVTGQYQPGGQQGSVYKVRVIDHATIEQRHATDLLGVLNTITGIRLTTDQTLGETGISLMGMSGENIKILLDGIPLLDRGATRNSLSQIDLHLVDHIEIVEGPLSVMYGTDALAGVVNIVTIKGNSSKTSSAFPDNPDGSFGIGLDLLEQTAGKEYRLLDKKGLHNANMSIHWRKRQWFADASLTRNNFGGWNGTDSLSEWQRSKAWLPKDQWLAAGRIGYRNSRLQIWYRLQYLQENIQSPGDVNPNTLLATDQEYLTDRSTHQLQLGWTPKDKWHMDIAASYQDYSRRTRTTLLDTRTNTRNLAADPALQENSGFENAFLRQSTNYRFHSDLQLQLGFEFVHENGSGPRIQGTPSINNYSAFLSGQYRPFSWLLLQPGARFSKNSIYDAPPVTPAFNAKFNLTKKLDLRISYARGFRAPALRELYFWFFDANHSIKGNINLKAEYAHAFNASLTWRTDPAATFQVASDLNSFYNQYNNRIDLALTQDGGGNIYTYINIAKYKTLGFSWNNRVKLTNWTGETGIAYIGRYNLYSQDTAYTQQNLPGFVWSPELTARLGYRIQKAGLQLALIYKYTGTLPRYELRTIDGTGRPVLAKTADFHWLDFTAEKQVIKNLRLSGGVKNIFNITELDNSATGNGGAHNTSGPLPLSYGRSYFLSISWNWP